LRKATSNCVMSVCLRGTAAFPLDRFSWNFIFDVFRACRDNSSCNKMW
jgi:hypothetical protein